MRRRSLAAISCLFLAASFASADVTLIYQVDTKLNPSLPAAMVQAMNSVRSRATMPQMTVLLKGGKIYTTTAMFTMIADVPNNKITLLDPANRHFVTIPPDQFANQIAGGMPQTPAVAEGILSSIKMTSDARLTGRTEQIQGIQAEEHEIVLSMSAPMGAPSAVNRPSGAIVKIVMQLWMAKAEEIAGNPALRELVASGYQTVSGMNPAETVQKMLGRFPGMADGVSSLVKEIMDSHSVTLRMHADLFIPMLATLAKIAPAADNPFANLDPNAAFMEMNEELVELSAAPVADAVFQIPDGYSAVSLSDITSAMLPKAPAPAVSLPVPLPALKPGEYRVGNGVSAPKLIQSVNPIYTEEARAAKIAGSVGLSLIVGSDGKPRDIRVIRSLEPGLDQRAIEAVRQWVFQPGEKDGVPVNVFAQIEVNFRLL